MAQPFRLSVLLGAGCFFCNYSAFGQDPLILRMPPKVRSGLTKECELTPDSRPGPAKIREIEKDANGKLILGGGGWSTAFYRDAFVKEVKAKIPEGDYIPLILSASMTPENASRLYEQWSTKYFGGKVAVRPIFTSPDGQEKLKIGPPAASPFRIELNEEQPDLRVPVSVLTTKKITANETEPEGKTLPTYTVSTDPDDETNLKIIRDAKTAIVVEGGNLGGLGHLVGTKLAEELGAVYRRGGIVYATSEGTNATTAINFSKIWPRLGKQPQAIYQPGPIAGLGITRDLAASSHIHSPRIISLLGFGEVVTEEKAEGKQTFHASNPYAFLDPMRQMASQPSRAADYPMFGIPDEAVLVYVKGVADFRSARPDDRFYLFDPRYLVSEKCDYYYIKPGNLYDLSTGRILPAIGNDSDHAVPVAPRESQRALIHSD